MRFIQLSEIILFVSVMFTIITQIAIPAIRNQPLFPLMRHKGELESELAQEHGIDEELELEQRLAEIRQRRNASRTKTSDQPEYADESPRTAPPKKSASRSARPSPKKEGNTKKKGTE